MTRWYRAPELLLASDEYTAAIDMWSVGCLLVELYSRKAIFQGRDVKNQIELICKVVGKPTAKEIESIRNKRAREFLYRLPDTKRINLRDVLPGACNDAVDIIEKLLQFDPTKRMSADEGLAHPYVKEFRDSLSEATATQVDSNKLEPPSERKLGRAGIRRLMWDEMLKFHPEARAREPFSAKEAEKKVLAMQSS